MGERDLASREASAHVDRAYANYALRSSYPVYAPYAVDAPYLPYDPYVPDLRSPYALPVRSPYHDVLAANAAKDCAISSLNAGLRTARRDLARTTSGLRATSRELLATQ